GTFLQHREKDDFIMVLQSGHHTDPADGKAFATYSVWKPARPRISYIRDQEVNEKYRPVRAGEGRRRFLISTDWTLPLTRAGRPLLVLPCANRHQGSPAAISSTYISSDTPRA